MVRVRYLWLSGWHCRPDFFLSRRFHQQPHSGFRSFCHRLSCKTAREHFLWFCRRLGGTRPRAENIAHHDGSANGTDWLLANLKHFGCAGSCFIALLKISAGIRDGGGITAERLLCFRSLACPSWKCVVQHGDGQYSAWHAACFAGCESIILVF